MDAAALCPVPSQSQGGLHIPARPSRWTAPLCQYTYTTWTGSMGSLRVAQLNQSVAGVDCASVMVSNSENSEGLVCSSNAYIKIVQRLNVLNFI